MDRNHGRIRLEILRWCTLACVTLTGAALAQEENDLENVLGGFEEGEPQFQVERADEEEATACEPLLNEFHGLLTAEDVAEVALELPQNSSAAVALFEHRWAVGLQWAVRAAGGQMLGSGFINPAAQAEVVVEVLESQAEDNE